MVVGASNIVGKPTAMMLMQQDATVAICHKKTRDLAQCTLLADILVVAAGVPGLIVPQMVRTGAVVIDVGINRLPDGRIVGDVDFEGVRKKASFISPVPGGVGPMTRAMLLHNTLVSAERAIEGARLARRAWLNFGSAATVARTASRKLRTRRRCNARDSPRHRRTNCAARQRCSANKNMHLRHFRGWHAACFTPGIAALSLSPWVIQWNAYPFTEGHQDLSDRRQTFELLRRRR